MNKILQYISQTDQTQKKNQINKPTAKQSQLDSIEQQKNYEIDLLKKDKEQLNKQILILKKMLQDKDIKIDHLENELKNRKLTENINTKKKVNFFHINTINAE